MENKFFDALVITGFVIIIVTALLITIISKPNAEQVAKDYEAVKKAMTEEISKEWEGRKND